MVNQLFNPDSHLNFLMCAVIFTVLANLRIILNLLSAPTFITFGLLFYGDLLKISIPL